MPNPGTNDQAQSNDAADHSQLQREANAKAAKKADKQALKAVKMQCWLDNREDHLPYFLSYGGTANGSKLT